MNLAYLNKYQLESCLDIGANVGSFYWEMKQHFNIPEWLLLEANRDCEVALSQIGVPYKICLLSDFVKTLPFYRNRRDVRCTGNSYYRELTQYYSDENMVVEYIQSVTLDSLVNRPYDLIKLDTQGSEIDILRGGLNTLSNATAVIIETSLQPYNQDAPLQDEVVKFMQSNNFENVAIVADVVQVHQQDILFVNTKKL